MLHKDLPRGGGHDNPLINCFTGIGQVKTLKRVQGDTVSQVCHAELVSASSGAAHTQRWAKRGFTLAEVLITLGIIGVVAAMTIPTLMTKYQDYVLQQQFNASYSKLVQAIKMIEAEEESVPLCTGWGTQCPEFYSKLSKQLKVAQYCSNKAYEKGCIPQWHGLDDFEGISDNNKQNVQKNMSGFCTNYILNINRAYVFLDGTILMPYNYDLNSFLLDVNGKKGPNKWGYDIHCLNFSASGENSLKIGGVDYRYEVGGKSSNTMISNIKKHK